MNCIKCKAEIPDGSLYCNYCGKKQTAEKKRAVKVRGNGMGCAYKRGNTWTACVTLDWTMPEDPAAPKVPIRKTKGGFPTKRDALAYCPTLKAGGVNPKSEAPRLSTYWKSYSEGEMLKLSKGKQCDYRKAWTKLKPLHDIRVDAITVDLLRKAVSDACPTFSTAKTCKGLLSNLFELAGADRFASRDLPHFISLPKNEEKERLPFTKEEQRSLWNAYDNGDSRAAIPLLMIYTGMMPGEAMMLKVENIDLEKRMIIRNGLKTEVRRETPIVLADCIVPIVEDLIAHAQPSGYIWKRVKKEWYQNYYDVLEAAGCRKLHPYSCRHTTATALAVDQNVSPQTIRKIMRWSTVKMLDHYAHPQTEDALEGVNTIKRPT